MGIKIEEVTKPVTLGEGPHWDAERQLLYFVSIMDSTIHKYDPATQLETRTKLPENVSFIVPLAGTSDQFAIALGRRVVVIRWDGNNDSAAEVIKTIAEVDTEPGLEDNKLNDGKADPRGRLFAGTLAKTSIVDGKFIVDEDTLGSLYSFSAKGAQKWDNGVRLSNGLCWNVDRKTMYYVDTLINVVYGYDYDVNIGSAKNRRIVFDYKKTKLPGMLDGMTIDTDGNLWIATFEGSQVIKVDPVKGEIIQKVALPISQITSVTFGGKDLDQLYVTSGNLELREKQEPPSGAMLKVTGLNVRGYPGIPCVL